MWRDGATGLCIRYLATLAHLPAFIRSALPISRLLPD